ncbi:MAG TPA: hypothetical protein VH331_17820 [Allosphingosinicella sp.]|jgi:hypothetical protein|nr:hypothetical protein [Allosphingosinicella sp.]
MKLFLLLSVQAAAAPAPAPPASTKVDAIDFDLARIKPADAADCDRPGGSEIVVCGRRKGYVYPLAEMAKIFEAKPLRAEKGIGNGATARVHVEDATMANGSISHRVMVGIKLPF